eukprot:gene16971-26039_t
MPFKIPPSEFEALVVEHGSEDAALLAAMQQAKGLPHHVPISSYCVGAALLARDKASGSRCAYLGINLELNDLRISMHGEQSAVHSAISDGALPPYEKLAVSAAPCGLCRQFLVETGSKGMTVVVEGMPSIPLATLLPEAFTPETVGQPYIGKVPARAAASQAATGCVLARAAYDACVQLSHSSWVDSPAAVSLLAGGGAVATGVFVESVAHNPTVNPAVAACNKALLSGLSLAGVTKAAIAHKPSK